MRLHKQVLALGTAVIVAGCNDSSNSGGTTPPANPGIGDLTLAFYNNLTTATAESNIVVDFALGAAEPLITNVHYDRQSVKLNLQTVVTEGLSTIALNVTRSDNMATLASSSVSVESEQYYTVVALGDVDNSTTDAVIFKQDRTEAASGQSKIRFIHSLSNLNTTPLNVSLNGSELAVNLDFKQASAYSSVTAPASAGDSLTFDVVQSGVVLGSGDCVIRPGLNYEAVVAYSDFNSSAPTVFCHPQ